MSLKPPKDTPLLDSTSFGPLHAKIRRGTWLAEGFFQKSMN